MLRHAKHIGVILITRLTAGARKKSLWARIKEHSVKMHKKIQGYITRIQTKIKDTITGTQPEHEQGTYLEDEQETYSNIIIENSTSVTKSKEKD